MMRRTASTQVCLDWWPGRAGLEQWRVLNLAGPFLAAAFARSAGPASRLATWLAVDPTRTAFDGRLLIGDDPVAAYASFAAGAVAVRRRTDAAHLTTLFPPVRPRGRYLEVRFPDAQEDDAIGALVEVLAALVHDDAVRADGAPTPGGGGATPRRALVRRGARRRRRHGPRPRARRAGVGEPACEVRHDAVLFVADPLAGLQPDIDASVGLMAATQDLGDEVWVCEPEDLAVVRRPGRRAGRSGCGWRRDTGATTTAGWSERRGTTWSSSAPIDVATDVDLTLLRIDPPVDARYLHTTYLLDLVEAGGGRVANRPAGIRALHEKLVALRFPRPVPRDGRHGRPERRPRARRPRRCRGGQAGRRLRRARRVAAPRRRRRGVPGRVRHARRHPARDRAGVPGRRRARQQAAVPRRRRDRRRGAAPTLARRLPDRPAGRGRRGRRRRPGDRRRARTAAGRQRHRRSPGST